MSTALELQSNERRAVDEAPISPMASQLTPVQMAYQLISSGADFASVKEMMALSKELAADQARRAFDEAVASAKAEIPTIAKNAKGHNNKAYANFAAYAEALKDVLAAYGLSYRFRTEQTDRITVTCVLSHKGGHSEENSLSGPADTSGSKNAIQAIGSTLTYLQRYTLIQALGLAAADDDDGANHGKNEEQLRTTSAEQRAELQDLIEKSGSDVPSFCQWAKVDSLADLNQAEFKNAVSILNQRIAKRGAQ
jgi:hypothetical protein